MKNTYTIDEEKLLERFDRYVRIWTTSDAHIDAAPTTERQWDLLKLLEQEMTELGAAVELDEQGFLIARLAGRGGAEAAPVIGFMAHVDTAADVSGEGVNPQVHSAWQGEPIRLEQNVVLDPEVMPDLKASIGQTIITSDGTTLLGADDKAGIAEIVTAVAYLQANPELAHGPLEIIFTPDEETGKGMDRFPKERIKSRCCYTLDGDVRGTLETECFNAYRAEVVFRGVSAHPGRARGSMVNAISMAGAFLNLLPQRESPEATDGRYGFYHVVECSGQTEEAKLSIILRDFEHEEVLRRGEALKSYAAAVEAAFPGGKVEVSLTKQYLNMREAFAKDPLVVDLAAAAIASVGMEPVFTPIRGGTDGSRLSEMGIPTPNLFTGGHNFHSLAEWASLDTMALATETIIALIRLWAEIDTPHRE